MRTVLALLALIGPAVAHAGDIPRHRLYLENITAVRVNPLGLLDRATLGWRFRLLDSDSRLFDDTYLYVGPTVDVSPAYVRPGVRVQLVPMAMLQLAATWRGQAYFGSFHQLQSWTTSDADWSDSAQKAGDDRRYATTGTQLELEGRVQAAVGPIAARETVRGVYDDLALHAGDVVYYDQSLDMITPDAGWVMVSDLDLMYIGPPEPFRAGVRWTRTVPFVHGDRLNTSDRVGPVLTWTFSDQAGRAFDRPTVLLLAQWHLRHPFRTGQDVSQAMPYLAVAFQFQGDLIPWK